MTEQENELMPARPLQPGNLQNELPSSQAIARRQERLDALEDRNAGFEVEFERLRASEKRYKAFIAEAGEGIWRFDFEVPISIDVVIATCLKPS